MLIGNITSALCISKAYKIQKPSRAVPEKAFSYLLLYAVSVVTDPSDLISLFTLLFCSPPRYYRGRCIFRISCALLICQVSLRKSLRIALAFGTEVGTPLANWYPLNDSTTYGTGFTPPVSYFENRLSRTWLTIRATVIVNTGSIATYSLPKHPVYGLVQPLYLIC